METPGNYLGEETRPQFRILRDGFVALSHGIARSSRLTVYEKVVYAILLGRLNKGGITWPSHETIAAEVPCSPRQVRTAVEGLRQKLGLGKRSGQTLGTSNTYLFDQEKVEQFLAQEEEGRQVVPTPSAGGADLGRQVVPTKKNHIEEEPIKKNQHKHVRATTENSENTGKPPFRIPWGGDSLFPWDASIDYKQAKPPPNLEGLPPELQGLEAIRVKPILELLRTFPLWRAAADDGVWLTTFLAERPWFTLEEARKFQDYHLPLKNGRKPNWRLALRNWREPYGKTGGNLPAGGGRRQAAAGDFDLGNFHLGDLDRY